MSESLVSQSVNSAGNMALMSIGSVKHLVGNTATELTRPAGATSLVLDTENGTFRLRLGSYASAGPELVTNGSFATDTDWTKGTGWSIGSGVVSSDGSQTADSDLEQTLADGTLKQGTLYKVTFTVSSYSAGSIVPVVGGTEGTDVSANGAVSQEVVAGSTQVIALRADANFVGSVDDFSITIPVMTYTSSPTTNTVGFGSLKLRQDVPVAITAPESVTVIGSSSADILTYYWV